MFGPFRRSPRFMPISAILVILGALFAVFAAAAPAQAADLVTSSPASGAKLKDGPGQIRLTFDDVVRSATITVTGPKGRVSSGRTGTGLMSATQSLRGGLGDGSYTVSYQAQIGIFRQPANGSYTFTIKHPVAATPVTPKPTPTKTPTPQPTKEATTPATTAASTTDDSSAVLSAQSAQETQGTPDSTATVPAPAVKAVSSTGSGHLPSPVVLWGLILVLCVVAVMISRLRRDSGRDRDSRSGDTDSWATRQVPRGQTSPSTGPTRRMAGATSSLSATSGLSSTDGLSTTSGPPTGVTRVQALGAANTQTMSYPSSRSVSDLPTQVGGPAYTDLDTKLGGDPPTQAMAMPAPPPPLAAPKAPKAPGAMPSTPAPVTSPQPVTRANSQPVSRTDSQPVSRAEARRAEAARAEAPVPSSSSSPASPVNPVNPASPVSRAGSRRAENRSPAARPAENRRPASRAEARRAQNGRSPSPLTGGLRSITGRRPGRSRAEADVDLADEQQGSSLLPHDPL